jgi:GT2 family glycosyltransferase
MDLRLGVIIATKGRPQEVAMLVDTLRHQTVEAAHIVVSACEQSDIDQSACRHPALEVIFGPPGGSVQRNRALANLDGKVDIAIFFDDDFIPSRFWLANAKQIFTAHTDIVCLTGHVLADGAKSGTICWQEGCKIVEDKDRVSDSGEKSNRDADNCRPYGCNMACRMELLRDVRFDERLPLYSWLEDWDIGARLAKYGKTVRGATLWGVHLGATKGKVSGKRYGYSQIVNPWYLARKRTMKYIQALTFCVGAVLGNVRGVLLRDAHVDRMGRLYGNMLGFMDLAKGRANPQRICEL